MLNSQIPARWLLRVNHPRRCFILGLSCNICSFFAKAYDAKTGQHPGGVLFTPTWSREIPVQLWFSPEVSSKMISTSENPESDFWICPETFLSMLRTYGQSSSELQALCCPLGCAVVSKHGVTDAWQLEMICSNGNQFWMTWTSIRIN